MESGDAYKPATYDGDDVSQIGGPVEWFSSAPAAAHTSALTSSTGRNFPSHLSS
jgi:hypothetical protein